MEGVISQLQDVRDDVRRMAGDSVQFIGYVRGLLGTGNNPLGSHLASTALAEQKQMQTEGVWKCE